MSASSSSRSLAKKARKKHPSRRGDVSSSAASSPNASEDEWSMPITPTASTSTSSSSLIVDPETTPKRKVVGTMEGSKTQPRKRDNLQARLAAAAKLQKSRSQGEGLTASASIGQLVPKVKSETIVKSPSGIVQGGSGSGNSKDKVVVCVRIKPTRSPFVSTAYELTSTSLTLSDKHPNVVKRGGKAGREDEYTYNFDALLQYPSRTPDLYERRVAPLVDKAMNGYNSTIFAYGQTGSGKSFTMTGVDEELGVIPCAVDGVFDAINADPERAFLLRVSYIEIYNETLRDLLNFKKGPLKDNEKPNIHFDKGKVYVNPLIEEIVSTPQDIVDLLEKGNTQRKTGATDWNERSSRSHSVFTIVIESKPRDGNGDDDVRLSRLTLIDLAGSEKAVADLERRGEGKHINRRYVDLAESADLSLLALKTVINKLTDKKSGHIPYRDSKLTHLLENALGGDSNICVICTLSAEEEHHAETLETLKFAGNCARVETKAQKHILVSSEQALIQKKDKEIEILKRRLNGLAKDNGEPVASTNADEVQNLADSLVVMEARKHRLQTQLAKLNTQVLTSELPRAGTGVPSLPSGPKRRRISDLYSVMGASRVGLGSPKQTALDNRRTVSSALRMPQVLEDEMPAIQSQLDQVPGKDRIVATLRKALTAKAAEFDSAIQQVTQLQAELSALQSTSASATTDHDAALQEYHNKLESTRTELVSTINDKAEKIDQLESTVLDLRTSREELLLEGEIRADELKVQLARAVDDSEALRTAHTAEVEAVRGELAAVKSTASQLPALQNEFTKIDDLRLAATKALEESMAATHEREAELAKSRKLAEQRSTELETLRSETAIRRALEGDQAKLEAMLVGEREGRRMAEKDNRDLVEQLGELRELRELRKAWLQEKKDLEARLDTASATTEEQRGLIESLTSRLDETAINHADAENAAKELQVKLRVSEQALHILTSEVYRLQMDLSTKTAESANRIISLESQVMAETSRSQMLNESKTALETSMVEKSSSLASAQAEIQKLQSFIATSSTSSTEQTALIASVEEQVRIEAGARKSSDEVRIALDEEVVDLRAAVEGHETEVGRLCKDSETARRKIEDLRREIQEARSAKEALGAELASTVIVAKDQRTEVERLVGELSVSRARLEEMERQLADTRVQLDAARQGRSDAEKALHSSASERGDKIKALSAEVVTLKARAEAKDAALLALKTVSDDDQSARQRLEGEIAQLRTERAQIEKTLGEDYAALQDCLDASTKEVGGIKAELEVANAERVRLQAQLDSTAKQGDGKVKEANEIVTSLRAQLRDTEVQIGDVESRLEAEVDSKMGVEKQLKAITADRAQIEAKVKHIEEQLAARQKAFDDQRSQLSTVTTDLKSRSAALAVAEQSATSVIEEKRQLFANLATIVDENTMHRSALTACQTQLDQTLADLAASNNASKKLSEDLAIARATEAATRPRHASTPTGSHAGTGVLDSLRIQALRSATTGEGGLIQEKLKTKEKSEIEKLEKIIEAQKEVIDDQREKIKFWAKELEQQREIVRMLTQDSNATPTKNSPRGHAKSKSMSAANLESPGPGPGSSHARVHLPNSFTAKNLALPTTPSPLPMHPSQFSNTSTRRGRRITIDHDMDLLTESSKVNKAKAVFDSPEKEERAAIALSRKKTVRLPVYSPTGSPIQRRP